MSLTSCYRYILELPVDTLNQMLRAAFSESDGAGISVSQHWEDVVIGGYTATVDVTPVDVDESPPLMILTNVDLELVLSVHMNIAVDINELPEMDAIIYRIDFDLPGIFEKDSVTSPPRLVMKFPSVTSGDLNLVISDTEIPLTPELIEPRIHALYDSDPTLGHNQQFGVTWPPPGDDTVMVVTDIYDDDTGSPEFRGAISVTVESNTSIVITMPGHFLIQGLAANAYIDTEMTIDITVAVVKTDGEIRVKISEVQSANVEVTFATSSLYDIPAKLILADEIASKISAFGDQVETIPADAEVRDMITAQLITFADSIIIPVFTPSAPAGGEIDLTTFVATTLNQQVLALQLEQLTDGTPCDTADVFAENTGFAIAVSAQEVETLLGPIRTENQGSHHIQGYDVTVNDLSTTLSDPGAHGQADGHIWIEGDVDVEVDCWADPNVEFWGPIFLIASTDSSGRLVFTADAGEFGADDPCCGDVSPAQISELIEGEQSLPIALPTDFSGVGELTLAFTETDISAAGIVIHGSLAVTTSSALHASALRKTLYWFTEPAA